MIYIETDNQVWDIGLWGCCKIFQMNEISRHGVNVHAL